MKRNFLFPAAALIAAFALFFVSCKKNDSGDSQPSQASVLLVNASPGDSATYDFYFNDVKLNSQPISYTSSSGYLPITAKSYTIKVAAANTINPVASGSFNFGSNRSYSVFTYDTLQSGKVKVFATEDDISAPAPGKAKVRFFHLSPVNIPLDILVNDSVMFANRSYADNVADNSKSAFRSVSAGTYTIKIKLSGSPETIPPLITLNGINFADGKVYTVITKGKLNGKGVNELGAQVIMNK
jgi:hypothetical protein